MKVADKIKEARKAKQLTQADLAARLGVEYKSILRWERGITVPADKRIPLLCLTLDLDQAEIFRLKNQNRPLEPFLKNGKGMPVRPPEPNNHAVRQIQALFEQHDVSPEIQEQCVRICQALIGKEVTGDEQ